MPKQALEKDSGKNAAPRNAREKSAAVGGGSRLALYIIAAGWVAFIVYVSLFLALMDGGGRESFLSHFLSVEENGIRFRALVFFTPFVCTVIGFLINEREKYFRKTVKSEIRYRDLFENANDPIFILDSDRNFVDVNKRAVQLFGYSREEFLNRLNLRENSKGSICKAVECSSSSEIDDFIFEEELDVHEQEKTVGKMRRKDGRWLDVEVSSSAIYQSGRITGYRVIVRDITRIKQMQYELTLNYHQMEERVVEKTAALLEAERQLRTEMYKRKKLMAVISSIRKNKPV